MKDVVWTWSHKILIALLHYSVMVDAVSQLFRCTLETTLSLLGLRLVSLASHSLSHALQPQPGVSGTREARCLPQSRVHSMQQGARRPDLRSSVTLTLPPSVRPSNGCLISLTPLWNFPSKASR